MKMIFTRQEEFLEVKKRKKLNKASVSGTNKCNCCSSHTLCYGCVQSYAVHNSFASYDGEGIHCCAKKADCL